MNRDFKDRWTDFTIRYGNHPCPFCKHQELGFSEPKRVALAGIEAATVTCHKCGRIEFFNIEDVCRIADDVDKDYREKGWR